MKETEETKLKPEGWTILEPKWTTCRVFNNSQYVQDSIESISFLVTPHASFCMVDYTGCRYIGHLCYADMVGIGEGFYFIWARDGKGTKDEAGNPIFYRCYQIPIDIIRLLYINEPRWSHFPSNPSDSHLD